MSGQLREDGSFPIHSRGSNFGFGPDEWWTYFFLQTWLLIRSELEADESARWEHALRCSLRACVAAVMEPLEDPEFAYDRKGVTNHYIWYSLVVYLGGRALGEKEWTDLGKRALDRLVLEQDMDGCWPENDGPTTVYNGVAAAGISLYAIHGDDAVAWRSVERALAFQRVFTYPDGPVIETIDGRVRYSGKTMSILPSGYGRWPEGRAWLHRQISNLLAQPFDDGFQGYSFFTDVARHAVAEAVETEALTEVSVLPSGKGAVVRVNGWVCVANTFLAPRAESRWYLDRQSHLSLWNRATGLITGGGGSKNQPEFSTLVLENADGSVRRYMADQAAIKKADHSGVEVELLLKDQVVTLQVKLVNGRQAKIEAFWHGEGKGGVRMVLQLPLRILAGQTLHVDGREYVLGSEPLESQVQKEISFDRWRIQCAGASLRWPVLPFNSYKLSGQSDLSAAYGLLRLPLAAAVTARASMKVD